MAGTACCKDEAGKVCAALQVGGDNYSLNYGRPYKFFSLDDYLLRRNVPLFLWGASVGPFDSDPEFAKLAHEHLKKFGGIFVRESRSLENLRSGVSERARLVSDPAFAMMPQTPAPQDLLLRTELFLSSSASSSSEPYESGACRSTQRLLLLRVCHRGGRGLGGRLLGLGRRRRLDVIRHEPDIHPAVFGASLVGMIVLHGRVLA